MGGSSSKDKKEENVIESGQLGDNDKSYITSVIQVLYNIIEFKKYFIQNQYNKNPNKYLSILMHKIIQTPLENLDFIKEGNEISKILRTKYNLNMASNPGEILIQILSVLKYEEKEMKTPNWEKYILNKPDLFNNISDDKKALNDILDLNKEHFNSSFSSMFFGVFCAKRKLQSNNNILNFYNFYCVYELNMPLIYQNMINKGKIREDPNNYLPKIDLIDCIKEMQENQNEIFNGENCSTQYYMFNAPNILIFYLKSETKDLDTFRGMVLFKEYMDFSSVVLNTQSNNFKLIAMINKDRYKAKAREKKDKKGAQWMANPDDDERSNYRGVFRDGRNIFGYYDANQNFNNCELIIDDIEYYHEILIFMRC